MELCADTGNVYETVAIIGKRANQISVEIKNDLSKKLAEFASYNDNLEEVFENREQIEISRYYEKLPKPDLIATQEYIEGKYIIEIRLRRKKNFSNLFSDEEFDSQVVSGMMIPAPYCLAIIV